MVLAWLLVKWIAGLKVNTWPFLNKLDWQVVINIDEDLIAGRVLEGRGDIFIDNSFCLKHKITNRYFQALSPCRLQDEIDDVMSVTTPETYNEDLDKMVYMEQIVQEVLRLYPVAVATTRTNHKDAYLGKSLIPARSTIMVRSSDIWIRWWCFTVISFGRSDGANSDIFRYVSMCYRGILITSQDLTSLILIDGDPENQRKSSHPPPRTTAPTPGTYLSSVEVLFGRLLSNPILISGRCHLHTCHSPAETEGVQESN